MRKHYMTPISLIFAAALCACSTVPPAKVAVDIPPPRLAPAPADVMVERDADFSAKLRQRFSSKKQDEQTK